MQTMVTRDAVGQLLADWAWGNDTNDLAVLAAILAEDATLSVAIAGAVVVGPLEGRDAIVGFVGEALGQQTVRRRHCVSNVRADGDDFTAYLTIVDTDDDASRVVSTGTYRGSVTAGGDAGPRFAALSIELDRPY